MYSNLTPPTFEEGFDKIIYIKTIIKNNKYETIIKEIYKTE